MNGVRSERALEISHGGDEVRPSGVGDGEVGEDLVADEEVANASFRVEREDLGGDPGIGERLVGGDGRDELVREHDGDSDAGAGDGGKDGGVGIVDLDGFGSESPD